MLHIPCMTFPMRFKKCYFAPHVAIKKHTHPRVLEKTSETPRIVILYIIIDGQRALSQSGGKLSRNNLEITNWFSMVFLFHGYFYSPAIPYFRVIS